MCVCVCVYVPLSLPALVLTGEQQEGGGWGGVKGWAAAGASPSHVRRDIHGFPHTHALGHSDRSSRDPRCLDVIGDRRRSPRLRLDSRPRRRLCGFGASGRGTVLDFLCGFSPPFILVRLHREFGRRLISRQKTKTN